MRLPFLASLAAAVALAGAVPASAATVVIWPIDPVIAPGESATALWLENKGQEPVTLQVRALAWTQEEGRDRLDADPAIIVSPPIADVAPGARQLVRLIRRPGAAAPGAKEAAYRLLIDEIPRPQPTGGGIAHVAVQMRYSVPLFTYAAPAKSLTARVSGEVRIVDGVRTLVLRNDGDLHARLTDLGTTDAGRTQLIRQGLAGYILPGATLAIPLTGHPLGAIHAKVNGVDQRLTPGA